jgi:hypothetical protein
VNKNALTRIFALSIVIAFLAVMLASPLKSFFGPAAAYASEDVSRMENILQLDIGSGKPVGNRNAVSSSSSSSSDSDVTVTNSADQGSFQDGTNINQDNDVVIGQCSDGHIQVNDNDKVMQSNLQSINQEADSDNEEEADSDNEANPGHRLANTMVQEGAQAGANINIDNDLVIILGCHSGSVEINDNDKVMQSNLQSINQEADSDNEEEADSD